MDTSFEQKVREKAYEIWKSAGMADGMAHEHWLSAEQEVRGEAGTPVTAAAKKKPAPKAPAPKAPAAKAPAKAKASAKPNAKGSSAKH